MQTLVTTPRKGSGKGKGKRDKDQNHMSNVKCWNCGKSGHYWRDCKEMWWSEEKATGKGRLNSAESSKWEGCQNGDEDGSFIFNKMTGEINQLREESGNYMFDVWIPPKSTTTSFHRQ